MLTTEGLTISTARITVREYSSSRAASSGRCAVAGVASGDSAIGPGVPSVVTPPVSATAPSTNRLELFPYMMSSVFRYPPSRVTPPPRPFERGDEDAGGGPGSVVIESSGRDRAKGVHSLRARQSNLLCSADPSDRKSTRLNSSHLGI